MQLLNTNEILSQILEVSTGAKPLSQRDIFPTDKKVFEQGKEAMLDETSLVR